MAWFARRKAAILIHQSGHSFDLPNFVSELRRLRIGTCTLDSPFGHELQETDILAPAASRNRRMKKDGNGWPPVTARSTELLEVVLD